MGSPFEAMMAAADTAIDATFGEQFVILPMARPSGDPNGRFAPDPNRWSVTVRGVWSEPKAAMARPSNHTGHPDAESQRFVDDKPSIDVPTAALPFELKIGDCVTRLKTGEPYAIASPTQNGFTRVVATLTARRGRS